MEDRSIKVLIRYWLPVILYLGMIFILSSIPNLRIPFSSMIGSIDKFAHILEYAPLGFLLMRALKGTKRALPLGASMAIVVPFLLVCGISDEIHQSFVPGRDPSISDLACDLIGGVIGSLLYRTKPC